MAALNFPTGAHAGDIYAGYVYDGTKWDPINTPLNELINGSYALTLDSSGHTNAPGNLTVTGDLTVGGTTHYVESTNTVYTDNVIEIHAPTGGVGGTWTSNDGTDIGIQMHYYNSGDKNAALVLAQDTGYLEWYKDATYDTGVFTGTYGVIKSGGLLVSTGGNITFDDSSTQTSAYTPSIVKSLFSASTETANSTGGLSYNDGVFTFTPKADQTTITGNAGTATKLATSRNINGVAFDGSANISVNSLINGSNTMSLASDGVFTFPSNLINTDTNAISLFSKSSSSLIWRGPGGPGVDLQTNITAVSGSANITLIKGILGGATTDRVFSFNSNGSLTFPDDTVQTSAWTGLQTSVTGNSGTATKLATARTINSIGFDGSANINVDNITNGTNTMKIVAAPSALTGASGDVVGNVAFDSSYIYYCTAAYVGNTYAGTFTISIGGSNSNSITISNNWQPGTSLSVQTGWTVTFNNGSGNITRTISAISSWSNSQPNGNWTLTLSAVWSGTVTTGSSFTLNTGASLPNIWAKTPWSAITSVPTATNSALGLVQPDGSSITISGGVISTSVGVAASLVKYVRTTQQTTGITANSVIICNILETTLGSDITYNTTTGKATLAANRTYRLMGCVPSWTSSGAQNVAWAWYNETASVWIGSAGENYPGSSGAAYGAAGGPADAVITVGASAITVSFRLLSVSGTLTALGGNTDFTTTGGYPWIDIQVVAGNATISALTPPTVTTSTATNSTSTSTGSIISAGGLGVALDTNLGGTLTVSNATNVTYQPGTATGQAITITAKNTVGGTGYADFLKVTNSSSGATNPNKSFRLDSSGTLQVLNSAYTANIFSVTDAGFIAINAATSATNGVPVNNGIAMNANSYIFDDGNYHITSKTGSIWLNANDGSTVNINTQMPSGITGGGLTVAGAVTSNATSSTAFIAGTGAISGVALQMPRSGAIRDVYNGASTIYFDVSTGGTTNGDFQFRSSSNFTNYLTINSSGLTSRTPSLGKLPWNSAIDTELTVDDYRFRVSNQGGVFPQIISNTGGTKNSAWAAIGSLNGAAVAQMGSTGNLVPNNSWVTLYNTHGMDAAGDTVTVTLQDKTQGRIYRITFMRSDNGSTTGYNIIAERLV